MLQAAYGDSLLLEYGSPNHPRRILIDGGPWYRYEALTERLRKIPESQRELELLVITHIDADHIDGIIRLLQDDSLGISFKDVWFNDWEHLQPRRSGVLGARQGEYLGALLDQKSLPWNEALGGKTVVVPESGVLPRLSVGGAELVLLSPGPEQLDNLRRHWKKVLRKADFKPGDRDHALAELARKSRYGPPSGVLGLEPDSSEANGSSIAFMFSYEGKRLLLAGDAFAPVLERSLQRLHAEEGETSPVEAFKLSHHGSFSNITRKLVRLAGSRRYLVSTDGAYFKHPDQEAIQLILANHDGPRPELVFNYRTRFTEPWADEARQEREGYTASYTEGAPLAF